MRRLHISCSQCDKSSSGDEVAAIAALMIYIESTNSEQESCGGPV